MQVLSDIWRRFIYPVRQNIDTNSGAAWPARENCGAPCGCELLEDRRLLAVSIDPGGWTVVTPSSDTRVVYVSSSSGSDTNSGLSAAEPVKTLNKASSLLRAGMPDWMLLKADDVWNGEGIWLNVPGRSQQEPILISSYGTGERPLLVNGRIQVNGDNVAITSLHLQGPGKFNSPNLEAVELTWNQNRRDLLFEDLRIEGYKIGMNLRLGQNVTVRRSVIHDNAAIGLATNDGAHQVIEENVIDANGIDDTTNHNIYKGPRTTDVIIRNNMITRGGNYGVKWRAPSDGGEIYGNLFAGNRNDVSIHLDTEDSPALLNNDIEILNNVFVDSGRNNQQTPIFLAHASNVLVKDNVIANMNATPYGQAIRLSHNLAAPNSLTNVLITGNTVANFTGTGIGLLTSDYSNVRIDGNVLQGLTNHVQQVRAQFTPGAIVYNGNTYHSTLPADQWFELGYHNDVDLTSWIAQTGEVGATAGPVQFLDDTRTTATYHASLGRTATHAAFMAEAVEQSKQSWDPAYTAQAVTQYVRDGFGLGASVPAAAEIDVSLGSTAVADGALTPVAFGTVSQNATSPELTFTVTNSGGQDLSLGQVVLNNNTGFTVAQQPAPVVAAGGSTVFKLRMPTDTAGSKSADVTFTNSDADANPYDFKVAGSVTLIAVPPAEVEVIHAGQSVADGELPPIDAGSVQQGDPAPELSFTIANAGGEDLTLGAVQLLDNIGFEVAQQPAATVAPGASTSLVLRMDTGSTGTKSATVSFSNNDADENPFDFAVAGAVTSAPAAAPEVRVHQGTTEITDGSAEPLSFGTVAQYATAVGRTFTITNAGGETLTLGPVLLGDNSGFEVVRQPDAAVAPGASTTFELQMLTDDTGTRSAHVQFTNNDAGEDPFEFDVTGTVTTATLQEEIDVRDGDTSLVHGQVTPVWFGSILQGDDPLVRTFHVWNVGGSWLSLGTAALAQESAGFEVVRQPYPDVAPGSYTTMQVRLLATEPGDHLASVSIPNNDADETPFTFPVAGTVVAPVTAPEVEVFQGAAPVIDGSTEPVAFGSVQQGEDAPERTFTVINAGGSDLSLGTVQLLDNVGFAVVRQPEDTVAPGASTTFTIRLLSDAPAQASAIVSLANDDADENPFDFQLAGEVTAPAPEIDGYYGDDAIVSGSSVISAGSVSRHDPSPTLTFTLANTGGQRLLLDRFQLESNRGFELVTAPASALDPGETTTFSIRMRTTFVGRHSVDVVIHTNDDDEPWFWFTVEGTVF